MKNFILIFAIFIILLQFILEVNTQAPDAPKDAAKDPAPAVPDPKAKEPAPAAPPIDPAKGGDAAKAKAAATPATPANGTTPFASASASALPITTNDILTGSIVGGIVSGLIFISL